MSSDERAYAEAVAANLVRQLGVDDAAATCLAEAFVGEVGDEPFVDAGLEPDDVEPGASLASQLGRGAVSDDDAQEIVEAWEPCADLPTAYADRLSADYELEVTEVACLSTALRVERDVLDEYLRRSLVTDRVRDLDEPLTGIVTLVQACTERDGQGGFIVEKIAASLTADGRLTPEQSQCVAQQVVDLVGAARLLEISGLGELEAAPAEVQDAYAQAIIDATAACGIQAAPPAGG